MSVLETTQRTRTWVLVGLGVGMLVVFGGLATVISLSVGEQSVAAIRSNAISHAQDPGAAPGTEAGRGTDQVAQLRAELQDCLVTSRAALEENVQLRTEIDKLRPQRVTSRDPQSGITAEGDEMGGVRTGEWTARYPNGGLESAGNYLQGKEIGEWKYWNEDGTLKMKGIWSSGQKVGAWIIFDHEANKVTEVTYINGVPTEAISK